MKDLLTSSGMKAKKKIADMLLSKMCPFTLYNLAGSKFFSVNLEQILFHKSRPLFGRVLLSRELNRVL